MMMRVFMDVEISWLFFLVLLKWQGHLVCLLYGYFLLHLMGQFMCLIKGFEFKIIFLIYFSINNFSFGLKGKKSKDFVQKQFQKKKEKNSITQEKKQKIKNKIKNPLVIMHIFIMHHKSYIEFSCKVCPHC